MTNLRLIATAVVCLAAGGAIGYKIADKKLGAEFEERLEKETNALRRMYKPDYKSPEDMVEQLHGDADEAGLDAAIKAMKDYTNPEPVPYHKIRTSTVEVPKEETTVVERTIFEVADDRGEIYVISAEENAAAEAGYENVTWTYYARDGVITDNAEDVIEAPDNFLGIDALTKFGGISGDPNVVYVRNEILMIDYEIVRNPSSYVEVVLGEEYTEPVERPSQRINRGG